MTETAAKTDPALWDAVKTEVTDGSKGGKPGQWSARKAQLATAEYKKKGGGYAGRKTADNHLSQWTREDWNTGSGEKSGDTGERYLPREAREALSPEDYARTTAKKRSDTRKGRQFSAQPEDVAEKTAHHRDTGKAAPDGGNGLDGMSRQELLDKATAKGVKGRSRMKKAELVAALS